MINMLDEALILCSGFPYMKCKERDGSHYFCHLDEFLVVSHIHSLVSLYTLVSVCIAEWFSFNYLENHKSYEESLLGAKCLFRFFSVAFVQTFFSVIIILQVMLKISAGTRVSM
jgi:hypothetical protein